MCLKKRQKNNQANNSLMKLEQANYKSSKTTIYSIDVLICKPSIKYLMQILKNKQN